MDPGWLVCDGRVLASLEIAVTRAERRRGLLGRSQYEGALLLERTRWVHTIGMRMPIDVAFLDADGTVLTILTMGRHRIGRPHPHADAVIEAAAGAFDRWAVEPGHVLEIRR